MFDALSYHRWEQMGAACATMARWTTSPIPIAISPMMQRTLPRFPRHSTLVRAASGMPWHAESISHPLRVSSIWEVVLGVHCGNPHRYPHLRAILFDFPQVSRLAEAVMRQEGLTDCVQIVGGDYEHDMLPPGPDVVLWSGNLHASSPESCRRVLTKLHALLPPGDGTDPRLYARRHAL